MNLGGLLSFFLVTGKDFRVSDYYSMQEFTNVGGEQAIALSDSCCRHSYLRVIVGPCPCVPCISRLSLACDLKDRMLFCEGQDSRIYCSQKLFSYFSYGGEVELSSLSLYIPPIFVNGTPLSRSTVFALMLGLSTVDGQSTSQCRRTSESTS